MTGTSKPLGHVCVEAHVNVFSTLVEGASKEKIEFLYCEKRKNFYADKKEIRAKRLRGFTSLKNALQKHLFERIEKADNRRENPGNLRILVKIDLSSLGDKTINALRINKNNSTGYTPVLDVVEKKPKEPEVEIIETVSLENIVDNIDLTSSPERADCKEEIAEMIKKQTVEEILREMEKFDKHKTRPVAHFN